MDGPVLVVDDDLGILEAVAVALEFQGVAVTTATNGVEALEVVERVRPSLVLLDLQMPVMDGWQFAAELKRRRIDLRIVVMTAAGHAERAAERLGACGYLDKPFGVRDLMRKVQPLDTAA